MDKLKELTDKLFNEGLSKGKEEGEALLAKAREEATAIVEAARKEAAAIVEDAEKSAEDLRTKTESDIKMASAQALQATRKDIENAVMMKIADAPVGAALSQPDFLKEIIRTVAKAFSTQEPADLEIVLPASLKDQLESFVSQELKNELSHGLDVSFSKKIAGGMTIGPKDGGYFISLTDETFQSLIGAYLRPVTKKFLFGQ